MYDNISRNNLARLNVDGKLDASFDPQITTNDFVSSNVAEDLNGNILFGAYFTFNGVSKQRIVRMKVDGTLDSTFYLNNETDSPIYSISLQSNQKILIGGDFSQFNGLPRKSFARLKNDGTLDTSFNVGSGANSTVSSIVSTNDDVAFISGGFSNYNGTEIFRIAKILTTENLQTNSSEKFKLIMYPNPVRDILHLSENNLSSYEIFNISGQKIYSEKIDKNYINLSKLMEGTYILNLTLKNGKTISQKFIKQ